MSLLLNLRHLESADAPIYLQDILEIDELLSSRNDIKAVTPFEVKLKALLSAGVAQVTGECTGQMQFVCSRCLTEYKKKMNIPVEHALTKQEEIAAADREQRIHLVHGDKVELKEYVEEDILLAMPYVLQCKPDCKGLCTQCGNNLNESSCDCQVETIDLRLEKLKGFFNA